MGTRGKTRSTIASESGLRTGSARQGMLGSIGETARIDWASLLDMGESEPNEKSRRGRKKQVDQKTLENIAAAHRIGTTTQELAEAYGVDERTITRWCSEVEAKRSADAAKRRKAARREHHLGMVGSTPTCLDCQAELTWVHEHGFARLECPVCGARTPLHRTDAECLSDARTGTVA